MTRDSRKPPAHWAPDPKWQRQPQTEAEWDWKQDVTGKAVERATKRLNFAADVADPSAPDQMATVLRCDLIRILGTVAWLQAKTAQYGEILKERDDLERECDGAASAMLSLYRAYVGSLESARCRITTLGGQCDSVEDMEKGDPALRAAREVLASMGVQT